MADLPITFSGPMVRALLREIEQPGTGKTQTRRVIRGEIWARPELVEPFDGGRSYWAVFNGDREAHRVRIPYVVGDRIYVREHWRTEARFDGIAPRDIRRDAIVSYEADYDQEPNDGCRGRFRQALHMPKWASRITLIVTDVRVERLHAITNEDCIAEGVPVHPNTHAPRTGPAIDDFARKHGLISHYGAEYMRIWNDVNGQGAWDKNPWVVAYTFKPILGHIDQVAA